MTHNVMGFADGENLVMRYEAMLKMGYTPKPAVIHEPGLVVWHPGITSTYLFTMQRMAYYQTVVGDEERLEHANDVIGKVKYEYQDGRAHGGGRLLPKTFKKEKRSSKTKSVDINMTVDALRAARTGACDAIMLLSGDGDYLPLIDEIMRQGVQVWLLAFSCGLNKSLRHKPDDFFNLDELFFEPRPMSDESTSTKAD